MYRSGPLVFAHKVVLLGNSGVGKTSLAHRWIHGSFDPTILPTIGPTNTTQTVDIGTKKVQIALWDTAGQEQFRSIVPLYMRGARSAVIVAAVDSPESFDSLRDWLELLNSVHEEPVQAVLAVNKTDMRDPLDSEISEFVERNRAKFASCLFVSALTGDGVKQLFREAAKIAEDGIAGGSGASSEQKSDSQVSETEKEKVDCC
jgi:small GTP-binding protein